MTGLSFLSYQTKHPNYLSITLNIHINELSVRLGQYFQYDSQTIFCSFHKYRTDTIRKGKQTDRHTLSKIGRCSTEVNSISESSFTTIKFYILVKTKNREPDGQNGR
jgi:hypothetical protein